MFSRPRQICVAAFLLGALVGPAVAQETETETQDMTEFASTCIDARAFFMPDLPADIDPSPMLTPLCKCLADSLVEFPEADIDMLTADLAGTASDEMHAAHEDYPALQQRVVPALNFCFATAEVQAGAALLSIGAEAE